ncbi:MAG: RHS repeat-associated core domain-containing protein [Candidatus Omnitrophica bacterium]|nr:RHS repeat-associated core domain-containing protein [Candidatus Omnitrophota bacterium]
MNLLDSSQSVVNTYIYTAFGETIINSEMVPQRYKFTGREWDSESSTQHSRERQYRPQWGRFLRRDPIGYGAGINLYSYCDNNPVNYTDPLGLWKIIRNSKMRRGIAIAELGDTIDKLARIVKLDPTEISRWAHKKSPLSLLLTMAVNPAISYSPKPDHSLMTSEIYDFPNTVHVAIGNVKPGPVEGFLFGNPHRMLAEQVSNDMITSAKNDGYFVEHDFDCETNDVTDMLNDSNIWGFVFWGHGGGNMADACLGFRTGTLYPGHIKLKYHLGKVILNSCYSNGNQGDGSQDFKSSFIGSNPYGVFKGCDSLWYIGLGIFITNAQLYWNEPLSDKQPLLPLGGGPRNPSNKVK